MELNDLLNSIPDPQQRAAVVAAMAPFMEAAQQQPQQQQPQPQPQPPQPQPQPPQPQKAAAAGSPESMKALLAQAARATPAVTFHASARVEPLYRDAVRIGLYTVAIVGGIILLMYAGKVLFASPIGGE